MGRLTLTFIMIVLLASCRSQPAIDLEKLTFNESVKGLLLKDKKYKTDEVELATSLPSDYTHDLSGFSFGPVNLTNERTGPLGGKIDFILNSLKEQKLEGLIITIRNADEAKQLVAYIKQKYGKPVQLSPNEKRDAKDGMLYGFTSLLWRNFQPGVTLIMSNNYSSENGKQAFSTQLNIIKNDAKPQPGTGFKTVADRIVASCTQQPVQ